jgi:diacylglycerol kinase family enzyme
VDGSLPVIVNAASGGGHSDETIDKLARAFADAGATAEVVLARDASRIASIARRAADAGDRIVVAAGGDGTVSAVAGALAGTPAALGIVALGTLNHFARDLGIPLAIDAAAKAIVRGGEKRVDVGEVNGRLFVNNSSIGLYPTFVLQRRHQQRLGRGRWHAFAWAVARVIARYPLLDLRLCLGDAVDNRRTPLVFVGNNVYGMEGFHIGRRERLDAGHLCVYVTQRRTRAKLFGLAVRALVGLMHQARDFEALVAQRVTIASRRRRLAVSTDGEVSIMDTPLEYAVRPGALRVRVPTEP